MMSIVAKNIRYVTSEHDSLIIGSIDNKIKELNTPFKMVD